MFVCLSLFELMSYIPVNSGNVHVWMLPPFYRTFTHDTQNVLHKYNHPSKPIKLICYVGLTKQGPLPFILGTRPITVYTGDNAHYRLYWDNAHYRLYWGQAQT